MKKYPHLLSSKFLFILMLCINVYDTKAQIMQLFTKTGKKEVSKFQITSQSTLTIADENNQSMNIPASEVDSFFIDNTKYLPVTKQDEANNKTVFARAFIEGHFSLLGIVKNINQELIFWEKDSAALFLDNEADFLKFREKVFLTQKLELIQLIKPLKFGNSNVSLRDLSKITDKMNILLYPKERIKTRVNATKIGFYLQGGISSSDILYQTPTTVQVAYENQYGTLGSKLSTNFGAFIQLNPLNKVTFELGFWYLKYQNNKVMTIPRYTIVDTLYFAMERFSIPFNIRYNIKFKRENMFFLKAGPQFNINSKLDSWIIPNYSRDRRDNLVKENTNSYGFNLGFGYSKTVHKLSLTLEYRYSYTQLLDGVTNLGKHFANGVYLNVGYIQR